MLGLLLEVFFMFAYVGGSSFKKPLTPEEEAKYIKDMENGDKNAKDVLIERNMRLVAHIVKKYTAVQQTETDELISIGTIGLIKAINTFNGEKGSKLATYASRCVENAMFRLGCRGRGFTAETNLSLKSGIERIIQLNRLTWCTDFVITDISFNKVMRIAGHMVSDFKFSIGFKFWTIRATC